MSVKKNADDLIYEIIAAFPSEMEKSEATDYTTFDLTISDPFEAARRNFFGPWNLFPRAVLIHPPDVIHFLDDDQFLKYFPALLVAEIQEDAECLGMKLDAVLLSSEHGTDVLSLQKKWLLSRLTENQIECIKNFLLYYSQCGWISEEEALCWPSGLIKNPVEKALKSPSPTDNFRDKSAIPPKEK